ncbi:MAG TPA: hypothetical protein VL281_00360 [Mycobacteriales bacterium]|jgi:hypothetical protein|nr:hypothetical protein [Mycobacteriales bacterium]
MRRLALLLVPLLALPWSSSQAAPTPVTTVGSPSVPGTIRGFQLVGHTDLGNRGMNSPLAVAGRCAYVGDRSYAGKPRPGAGIAIVDVSRPSRPTRVGTIAARPDATQRELRADAGLGLLVVEDYSGFTGGDQPGDSYSGNDLQVYDISRDCRKPRLLSTYDFGPRSPHEFFLWKDAKHPGRVLAYVTTTLYGPDLNVLDLTDPTAPKLVTVYEAPQQEASGLNDTVRTNNPTASQPASYIHSIAVSDDGTRAYVGGWDYGTYVLDTSGLADPAGLPVLRPLGPLPLDYGANVHGTVPIPGKPYGVMVQEEYAAAGRGCPFGWLRMADLTDPTSPKLAGAYRIPENDCARAKAANGTFTAHNQTTFPSVTLLSWYSGGLRAVDTTNPYRPVETGVFVPRATQDPPLERDTRLFFPGGGGVERRTGAMWSYPVVQDGLVYVVDIDLGLFVLRYTGKHAAEVGRAAFVEGNSSPSRYTAKAPVIRRPAALAVRPPVVVHDPTPLQLPTGHTDRHWTWVC